MSVTLVKINNPFDIRDRDIKSVKLDEARPFHDFLSEHVSIGEDLEYHASINGRVFAPDEIPAQLVAPGDYVAVCPVLRGGGGNGGKNPLAILAGIALAAFAFGVVAPGVTGMFGGSAIAGKLAGGITLMVGGQLISNAFGPKMKEAEDTESYRWGSLQPITAQGAVIPITYGTVRTAGQILNQYIRVDGDTQYMELLLCGGQGPITEFSDIRINDNPAENFQNVTWDTRPGNNSQTPISGFENLYDTQYVGVTLKCGLNEKGEEEKNTPGEWFTAELEGDTADYLEVTLDFPEGMGWYPETRSGPESHWVKPEFQYSMQTSPGVWGGWVDWFTEKFEGATSKPFTRSRRTGKLTPGKYRVRGRMFAKAGAHPTKDKNTTVWTSLTSIVESPMVHPGKALLGIRMQATDQLNGGTPTVTWRQTRDNVLVYMNGLWQWKNARNPAWIIYDLCVQARFLDGTVHVFGEPPERMDLTAFAAWAAWNEQTLGNRGPIVMNLLVDETKDLWQWVNDVAASARGAVVMRGTKISCIWDQPSEPVQLFSMGNIVAGSFSGEFLSVDGRANAVEISFLNEAKNFEREQITVYGHGFDDADNRANPVSVELTGITNFDAAWQEGLYRLNQNRYILRTITFTADIDAIACQVGDVILVQHDVPRWGQGGRILSVDGNQVVVDHTLNLDAGVTYNVMIRRQSDDSILQRTATGSGATNMITISSAAGLSPYDVFAIGEMQAVAKPFRVQEMSRSGDLHVTLTCTEYIAALYTEDGVPPIIDYSLPSNRIAGLALTPSGYYSTTGQWVPELWANWSYRGQKPASYEVEWKYDQGLWEQRRNTIETTAQCPLRETVGLYSVRVRALYTSAPPSDWVYATSEGIVIGNGIPPDAPTNLRANGLFGFASLEWVNPTNSDLSHIEVWENDKDELATASMVGQTRANSFTRLLPAGGTKWYWVRAVNYTGQKSDYNSQAGTPCVIDPESAEAWITNYIKENPWLLDALDELNTRIEPLEINIRDIDISLQDINVDLDDIDVKLANVDVKITGIDTDIAEINTDIAGINTDIAEINTSITEINTDITEINTDITEINTDIAEIKEITIPTIQADLQGQITDNRNEINQNLETAMDMIAEGVLRLADQADYVGDVFRWAGMEIDPEEGTVVIRALEDLKTETGYQFSNVEQRLDAQTADINLKASRAYVDESVASIIAAIIAAEEWKFNGTLGGWTAQNATLTAQPGGMQYVVTAGTPSLTSPDFSIPGSVNNIIGLQFSQTAGTINATIKVQYKTPDHGYSDSYMRRINVVGDISFTRSVQINMHELTAGGSDWKDSTITGIRLFIGSAVGQEYQINFVNIGQSSMSELALQDLELRMTQAEIDINGANAAIALKADETTVTALQQRLNSAEVRIDAINSAIALKADQTTVDGVNTRLQSAEVEIDALNGRISQQVIDYEGIQGQIDDLTAASLQNSINEHEGQEERRIKLALARQELNARIDDTNEAVSNYRLELLAIINENSALYEEQITAVANDLSAEVQSRETLAAKVGQNTAAIQTEQTARSNADTALSNRVTTLQGTVDGNTAAIQTEQTTRANADTALSNSITTLQSAVSSNTAAIQTEQTTRANADTALSSRITTLQSTVNENTTAIQTEAQTRADADTAEAKARQALASKVSQNTAAIQSEATTRANADEALSASITTLQSAVDNNTAAIQTEAKARADGDKAEAQARQTLAAKVNANTAAIQNETTTRSNADSALSAQISTLQVKVNNNTAAIQAEETARTTADTAEANSRKTLQTKVDANTSAIQTEETTRTNADNALSSRITSLQSKVDNNTAEIQTEQQTRANADSVLASQITSVQAYQGMTAQELQIQLDALTAASLQGSVNEHEGQEERRIKLALARQELNARIDETDEAVANYRLELLALINENGAYYEEQITAVANDLSAEVQSRETLAAKVGQNTSAIQTEQTTRANADNALSIQITTLQGKVDNNTAAIQTEQKARADADSAEAQARQTLATKVNSNTAAIQTEQTTRANADTALSNQITTLRATVNSNTAAIQAEETARAAADTAEANARKTLQATVDKNTTAIQTEETARINADNGLSSRITSLQTKVNTNTAEIQTEQQTRANADSVLASQITSIQAYEGLTAEELQAQLDALTAASFQNSINEHEGQEERRIKLALAREELSAEIDETNRAVSEYRLQLLAVINENSALYDRKIQAVANDLSAEVESRETLAATVGQNTTAIRDEQTTRANADSALSSQISTLTTKVNGNTAAIQSEAKTRADADTAEANARQTLQTKVNANTAAIQTETNARVNADNGLVSQISTLQTKVGQNTTAIQDEKKARADADTAEANARITLQSKVEDNSAAIQDEQETRASAVETLAQRIEQIQAVADDNSAAIKEEKRVRATENGVMSQNMTNLQTAFNGHTSSIQVNALAVSDINGKMETTYTIKLDNNDYVMGTQLLNGGPGQSAFVVSADSFMVAKPGSTSPRQMMVYDSETGRLVLNSLMVNRASIKDASVDTIKIAGRSVTIPVGVNGESYVLWREYNPDQLQTLRPLRYSNGHVAQLVVPDVVANQPIWVMFTCQLTAEMCQLGINLELYGGYRGVHSVGAAWSAFANERRSGSFSTAFMITPTYSQQLLIQPEWQIVSTYGSVGTYDYRNSYISKFSILALQCKR